MSEYRVLKSSSFDRDIERIQAFFLANEATDQTIHKTLCTVYHSKENYLVKLKLND